MICQKLINQGIDARCDLPMVRGFEPDGIIINYDDIDFAATTVPEGSDNVRTVVLKSGKTGYPVKQPANSPFTGSESTLNVGTYASTWEHSIQLILMSVGAYTSELVDKLASGRFVLILRNKTKTDAQSGLNGATLVQDASEYQIFGLEQGMTATAGTRTPDDEDTMGGTLITLTETGAPSHGLFLWSGTKASTNLAYNSLLESKHKNDA